MDTVKDAVACLLDVMEGHGVKNLVCSPGSRNAPLLMGARSRENFNKHIVIDERSAAFMALGIALVTNEPVALICTSGTALLNYAPAVAEAYYQGIPLIVVSADRPKEWIDQDDSQTLRQFEALGNFVKGNYDISDRETTDAGMWYVNRIANDAMLSALRPKQGPVHINLRLSPPLNELRKKMVKHRFSQRIVREIPTYSLPDKTIIKELAGKLIGKKIIITVGFHRPDSTLNKALLKLRRHPNVVIMAETISNTHLPAEDYVIDAALCNLHNTPDELRFRPDVIISTGGALISRMLKEFLRSSADDGIEHWSIGPNHTTVDPFKSLTLRIESDPGRFLSLLSAEMAHKMKLLNESKSFDQDTEDDTARNVPAYGYIFNQLKQEAISRINNYIAGQPWSELLAFSIILNSLPREYNLYLSNGTAIRYAQLIPYSLPHASFCNRGVSGIEGSTSTATGGALAYRGRSIMITGDMSFSHDLGGMAMAARNNARLDIIVINNSGGGIFRFIDSTSSLPDRELYFCADPAVDIKGVAEAFGFIHYTADSTETLELALKSFYSSTAGKHARKLLEVRVPPEDSADILRKFLRPL
ncbi:MAG: 2-succinyl-5-enolpyruvyl-6-hydroxy-3-cyclohexene-1-carboxylic-acid synthase [Muribaculaceae bacterium]|nr:2-succinyl-5-enolpyruvyl-6-hydroxy-3-cyclohexene-1-carboxylic-acid synthase [Muribaculaceae bacterium]